MSLTDEIYIQLKDGLWTGLDYDGLRSKYEKSKGPFYNALQMVFDDASAEMTRLSSEMKALKEKGEKEKAKLNNLVDQQEKIAGRIKTGQQEIERLATEEQATKAKIEAIGAELQASTGLLNQAQELQKMGFDNEKLRQLSVALMEIGTKQGRKPSEAIDRFFNDLQDYDTKVGFERELQRLATITETKKLEAENWQARAERLESQYANLKEAIDTIQTLFKQRVKGEQIVSWNSIVNKLGGPDRIQEELEQYKSMSEVLDGKGKEIESRAKKITELSAQTKALAEQKLGIEAAIKSLSTSGVKKVAEVSEQAMTGLKSLSASGVKEVTTVGDKATAELSSLLAEIRAETKRLAGLNAEAGKFEKELMYARYFTTDDESVLKSFPKEVIISFLERALVYCELNRLNPKVRAPDGFHRKYIGIQSHTEVDLIGLIRWVEAGLAGAAQ